MTTSHRAAMLQRIRAATGNPHLAADRASLEAAAPLPAFDPLALVDQWRQEFQALGGVVYEPTSLAEVASQIATLAQEYHSSHVLTWAEDQLPLPGLREQLRQHRVEPISPDARPADYTALAALPIGLTGTLAGLADTGSLIVHSGAGRMRTASLLPPVLIALLRPADLFPDLPTWMAQMGSVDLPTNANLTIITGPSRTADIEKVLVVGVHGPGKVYVILMTAGIFSG